MAEVRIPTRLRPAAALTAAQKALRDCNVRDVAYDERHHLVTGRIGASLLSWGESIEVAILTSDDATEFVIRSDPSGPQVVDWGKNASNVQRIKQALERA